MPFPHSRGRSFHEKRPKTQPQPRVFPKESLNKAFIHLPCFLKHREKSSSNPWVNRWKIKKSWSYIALFSVSYQWRGIWVEDLLICSLQIWLLPLPGGQSSSLGKDQGGKGESDFLYSDKKKTEKVIWFGNKVATELCERWKAADWNLLKKNLFPLLHLRGALFLAALTATKDIKYSSNNILQRPG